MYDLRDNIKIKLRVNDMEYSNYLENSRLSNVEERLEGIGIDWNILKEIYEDYTRKESDLYNAGYLLSEKLKNASCSHIVHYRTKNPVHLLDKIIRKMEEKGREINKDNYMEEITDLIGIRILHLYKEDWLEINKFIVEEWGEAIKPTANIREGDSKELYEENGCEIKVHKAGYRSVHYLIETSPLNEKYIAEVQVRTLFEEAWSEVDHDIRYPIHVDNPLVNTYLMNFNRLAGSADEMSTYLKYLGFRCLSLPAFSCFTNVFHSGLG